MRSQKVARPSEVCEGPSMSFKWILGACVFLAWGGLASGCDVAQALSSAGSGSGGSTSAATTGASGTTMGLDCGQDPATGAVLCLGISSCPNVIVDTEALPGCGFRIDGSALDLECSCSDSLCPLGPAVTCADAQALIMNSNEGTVCAQLAGGTCQSVTTTTVATTTATATSATTATATSAASTGSSTCDQTCYMDCGGDPTCIQFCGC